MKIRIRRSFSVYILILAIFAGVNTCIGMLVALTIHEACHAAAARLLREPVDCVELAPFGGVMRYKCGMTASKGLRGALLAMAGPMGNYIVIMIAAAMNGRYASLLLSGIARANLSMLILNLLPALPFDGGMILFCLGYYLFDVSALISILCFAGMLVGFLLCIFACIGVMTYETLNLSLIVVGGYVLCYARLCKGELMAQNAYVLMCERGYKKKQPEKIMLFKVCADTTISSLIPCMCKGNAVAFLVEKEDGKAILIGDTTLSREIMREPQEQIDNLLEKIEKKL